LLPTKIDIEPKYLMRLNFFEAQDILNLIFLINFAAEFYPKSLNLRKKSL